MSAEFKEWPKIPRWKKQLWTITEKIDGTNACVIVPENKEEPIACQSRNRILTLDSDNFGFAKWVEENKEQLRWLGPGYHYGEWWGLGIGAGYGLNEKRFSLFSCYRWNKSEPSRTPPPCCHVVPLIKLTNDINCIEQAMADLKTGGSLAAPGFMEPEGIVISTGNMMFKKTFRDEHKGE